MGSENQQGSAAEMIKAYVKTHLQEPITARDFNNRLLLLFCSGGFLTFTVCH